MRRGHAAAVALAVLTLFEVKQAASADDIHTTNQLLVMVAEPAPHYRPSQPALVAYGSAEHNRRARSMAAAVAHSHGLAVVEGWPMPALAVHCFLMTSATSVPDLLSRLRADPRVESVETLKVYNTLTATGGPQNPPAYHIDRPGLHQLGTGHGISVAQIDTGVDLKHPQLRGQIVRHQNFVDAGPFPPEKHGTAVAGILAARSGNGIGPAGLAPGARLLALRACTEDGGDSGVCTSFAIAKALQFALAARADIVNFSLGGPADGLLARLLDVAQRRGVTLIGATDPARPGGGFPASHDAVIAVAGSSTTDDAAGDVIRAPDQDVLTTIPGGRWGFVSGTSVASAQASGIAAILAQQGTRPAAAAISAVLARHVRAVAAPRFSALDRCTTAARVDPCHTRNQP